MPDPRPVRSPAASFWHRFRRRQDPDASACMADVLACYRLLLGRQPDPEGLAHYTERLQSAVPIEQLVDEFLSSMEFDRLHPGFRRPERAAPSVVTTTFGFRIQVDPTDYAVGHTIARTGTYEPEVSAVVSQILEPGDTFVDIGANIGWFSLLAATQVGPSGRVLAIEPNPGNIALLQSSIAENELDNTEVMAVALSDHTGAVALETDGSNGRVIFLDDPPVAALPVSYVVACHPLDALLASCRIDRVDVVKMDVEGAEPLVVQGGAETFEKYRPVLVSEFFPRALDNSPGGAAAYLAALRDLGYTLSVIGNRSGDLPDREIMALARGGQVNLLARPT
ncbi:MAG TPA: FkbM family methyltransferase [Acidimicrobiales bacterium]|nr:FkbM family methyltransferase [Acidimicrobiales bacterium]